MPTNARCAPWRETMTTGAKAKRRCRILLSSNSEDPVGSLPRATWHEALFSVSLEPSTLPPPDCADNALFRSMWRHCDGRRYADRPLGAGGTQCELSMYFGNHDSWSWADRGCAIEVCAGVR